MSVGAAASSDDSAAIVYTVVGTGRSKCGIVAGAGAAELEGYADVSDSADAAVCSESVWEEDSVSAASAKGGDGSSATKSEGNDEARSEAICKGGRSYGSAVVAGVMRDGNGVASYESGVI